MIYRIGKVSTTENLGSCCQTCLLRDNGSIMPYGAFVEFISGKSTETKRIYYYI